jgi:hypothetical protein
MTGIASTGGLVPSRRMRMRFFQETAELRREDAAATPFIVKSSDIDELPLAAQRYLRFMGVIGQSRARSFRGHWAGRFRMGAEKPWMPCEVWQLNVAAPVTRIFHMRVRFGGLVPVYVRDTYAEGRGRMRATVLSALDVVDQHDHRITIGELVTYLNDALLFAPSMLLAKGVCWREVDDRSFDVGIEDRGCTVTGRVTTDERGALVDFSTTDRFGADPAKPHEMVRARWTTPVHGWRAAGQRMLPARAEAVWHFPQCEFAYAAFDFADGTLELDPV